MLALVALVADLVLLTLLMYWVVVGEPLLFAVTLALMLYRVQRRARTARARRSPPTTEA